MNIFLIIVKKYSYKAIRYLLIISKHKSDKLSCELEFEESSKELYSDKINYRIGHI